MEYPQILENNLTIQSYLIDDEMNLSKPSLFRLIQEISSEHVSKCNIGWHQLRKANLFWVLSKIDIQINKLPKWYDKVILRTWGKFHDLLVCPRDYEMVDENGELLLKGTSSWVIIDGNNGKVQKLEQFEDNLIVLPDKEAIVERAPKVPKIELPDEVDFSKVLQSDIDMNKHVNNSNYIQWAVDSVGQLFNKTHVLKEAVVNYLSQAKLGDLYGVFSQRIAENIFITSIFSKSDKREFCRIKSVWIAQ